MGRAMLIFVVMMTAIYSTVLLSLQRRMLDLPRIIQRNQLTNQAESVFGLCSQDCYSLFSFLWIDGRAKRSHHVESTLRWFQDPGLSD
jgi:hypothetical protein